MPCRERNCRPVAGDRARGMAFALAQRGAEFKAEPSRVEPAPESQHVRAIVVHAAQADRGTVSLLELVRPGVAHSESLRCRRPSDLGRMPRHPAPLTLAGCCRAPTWAPIFGLDALAVQMLSAREVYLRADGRGQRILEPLTAPVAG